MNNNGPKTDPWGILKDTNRVSDFIPSNRTNRFLSHMQLSNNFSSSYKLVKISVTFRHLAVRLQIDYQN